MLRKADLNLVQEDIWGRAVRLQRRHLGLFLLRPSPLKRGRLDRSLFQIDGGFWLGLVRLFSKARSSAHPSGPLGLAWHKGDPKTWGHLLLEMLWDRFVRRLGEAGIAHAARENVAHSAVKGARLDNLDRHFVKGALAIPAIKVVVRCLSAVSPCGRTNRSLRTFPYGRLATFCA